MVFVAIATKTRINGDTCQSLETQCHSKFVARRIQRQKIEYKGGSIMMKEGSVELFLV
jgi:hypothetical protein